jgi:hypothetical protein
MGIKKYHATTKLKLPHKEEILLNRTRCDLLFRNHLYSHNFVQVRDPSCQCGSRNQTSKHVCLTALF